MTVDVRLSGDGLGAFFIGSGLVKGQELLGADDYLYGDEDRVRRLRYILSDYTATEDTDIGEKALRASLRKDMAAAAVNPEVVVVAVGDWDFVFGLTRMWQSLADLMHNPWKVNAVRTVEEAKDWIHEQTGLEVVDYP